MLPPSHADANKTETQVESLRERMRQRRPHLFSDTVRSSEPQIAREVLDYHLETLTKRKQEYQFEHFARAIAEKELCPNLRTQTGPTGGDDAKVDSETYAVAPEISERWFVGQAAANERWAFAFSTKEAWQTKVRSDVLNIFSTSRDYARIYFITSRYAPDKPRSAIEDKLSAENGIPITILDRAWILDRVYANDRIELAIETLGLTSTEESVVQIGPNDVTRLRRLEELDRQIADPARYKEARYSLAEDCFTSALLARGLERPRAEVEARFAQARRFSEECGVVEQCQRFIYFEAWTAFWWYEDRQRLIENYQQLEILTVNAQNTEDLERLMTLWQLLSGSCISGLIDATRVGLEDKRATLVQRLQRLADDSSRPNSSVHARYVLAILDAHLALASHDIAALELVWDSLIPLISEVEPLLSLPLERMVGTLEAMAEYLPASDAYERLLDNFLPILERRRSTAAAGHALMRRGLQKLEACHYEDAVRLLGRAELRLAKEEHNESFVCVMLGIARAYSALGLPWAARTKLLMAVDRSFAILKDDGDIPPSLLRSLHDLTWVEILLGRLPQALAAWRHFRTIAPQFEMNEDDRADLEADFHVLGRLFGHMLLNATSDQLTALSRLPDCLGILGLDVTAMLLLWGLGHEALVRDRYFALEDRSEDLDSLFEEDLSHEGVQALPRQITIGNEDVIFLTARALGCELRFQLPNDATAIPIAEAVASAFEAFLSTSLNQHVIPYRDYVKFELQPGTAERFSTKWHTSPETWALLVYPAQTLTTGATDRTGFEEWLQDLIGQTIARTLFMRDPEAWLKEVAGTEEGLSRAITLGNVPILTSSIFGGQPQHRLDYWIQKNSIEYPNLRAQPWLFGRTAEPKASSESPLTMSEKQPAPDNKPLFENHSRMRVASIIDMPLWDSAHWSGTGMAMIGDGPPVLALCFEDIGSGANIFESWRARFGSIDEDEIIRISIIQGLTRRDPNGYAVTVGCYVDMILFENPDSLLTIFSRINRMEHASPENLKQFLIAYERHGAYRLVPMQMTKAVTLDAFRFDLAITKRKLELRQAWQIGPNDLDMSVLRKDDDPLIPRDVEDPPVRSALERIRSSRGPADANEI